MIKYVDIQSLYHYVSQSKHYSVGHPRCPIGPNFRGLNVNSYEGLIKCKILTPSGCALISCSVTLTASLHCVELAQRRRTVAPVVIRVANIV